MKPNNESKVSESVRLAITNATEKGEALSRRIKQITLKAVKDALDKKKPSIKKIEEVASEAARGFSRAASDAKLKAIELFNSAVEGISEGAGKSGERAAETAAQAAEKAMGLLRQTGTTTRKKVKETTREISERIRKKISTSKSTTFRFSGGKGKDVFLAGSFNSWDCRVQKMNFRNGTYSIKVELPPGRHEYKFVCDGEWLQDPNCEEQSDNEFGSPNSVVEIR
jgi:hypothetical protein